MILSLFSKKFVPWYEGVLEYDDDEQNFFAEVRRNQPLLSFKQPRITTETIEVDLLAKPSALVGSTLFEHIISNFRGLPDQKQEMIRRVIQNLLITYETNYLEVELGIIYTALEMLIFGLGTDQTRNILSDSDYKKLKTCVKRTIKKDLDFTEGVRKELYEKLSELKRRTYESQLENVLRDEKINLDVHKFFPNLSSSEESELHKMITRRNDYIHQGKIDNYIDSNTDFHRIRLLIEMTLFKLLGYPLEEINYFCDDLWYIKRGIFPEDYSFEITTQPEFEEKLSKPD